MCPAGAFDKYTRALPCWAAEAASWASALQSFFSRLAVYPNVFANAADIILVIHVTTDVAV